MLRFVAWLPVALGVREFCQNLGALFCNTVPRLNGGGIDFNHPLTGDPAKPWVIGGSTVVSLPPGIYSMPDVEFLGPGTSGKMIWIIDDAVLAIEDTNGQEVAFGANIALCDRGTFRVKDGDWRLQATYDYEFIFSIYAAANSQVHFEGAAINTVATTNANQDGHSHFGLHWMRDNSHMQVQESAARGYGLQSSRGPFKDSWEFAVMDSATANITKAMMFAELYIANEGDIYYQDSQHSNIFFEICSADLPDQTYTIPPLPDLCDTKATGSAPVPTCFTPQHPPVSWEVGPPEVPFHMKVVNSKMFSYQASMYYGSRVTLDALTQYMNFGFGFGIEPSCPAGHTGPVDSTCQSEYNLTVKASTPTTPAILDGFGDLFTVTYDPATTFIESFQLWPRGDPIVLRVLPGSSPGDIIFGSTTVAYVYEITQNAQLYIQGNGKVYVYNSVLDSTPLCTQNAQMYFEATQLNKKITVDNSCQVFVADGALGDSFLVTQTTGRFFYLQLDYALGGQNVTAGTPLVIKGSAWALTQNNANAPFGQAELRLVWKAPLPGQTRASPNIDLLLGQVDVATPIGVLSDLVTATLDDVTVEGTYELQLRWSGAQHDEHTAASRRTLYITIPGGGVQDTSAPTTATGAPTTAPTTPADDDGEMSAAWALRGCLWAALVVAVELEW
jgi:hypothetical protein